MLIRLSSISRTLLFIAAFVSSLVLSSGYVYAYSCLPNCSEVDGRFFVFQNFGMIITRIQLGIISPPGADEVEIGIFDGDDGADPAGFWDAGAGTIVYTMFADPDGDGSGTFEVAEWTSDGSSGNNAGTPMPDNDWFIDSVENTNFAKAPDGKFKYYIVAEVPVFGPGTANIVFKFRTDGILFLFPHQNINFVQRLRGGPDSLQENIKIIYPDFDFDDPACFTFGVGLGCSRGEPGCCTNRSTYDGTWDYFFDVPENTREVGVWDADFDFSSAPNADPDTGQCIRTNIVDTDDPNTPNTVPAFAVSTNAKAEGANGDFRPPDDTCNDIPKRSPAVVYDVIDPVGNVFHNPDVSGNQEWELFNLSIAPFDPSIMDFHVDSIEPGIWNLHVRGADLGNVFAFRFLFAVIGQDEGGNPTLLLPTEPTSIPTMGEWAMIFFAAFAMMAGVYFMHRMRDISHM